MDRFNAQHDAHRSCSKLFIVLTVISSVAQLCMAQKVKPGFETGFNASTQVCRTGSGLFLASPDYELDTCAACYSFMPDKYFHFKLQYVPGSLPATRGRLLWPEYNVSFPALLNDTLIRQTFISLEAFRLWTECCHAAVDCCVQHLARPASSIQPTSASLTPGRCPAVWDGWACWADDVPAEQTVTQQCPKYIYFDGLVTACRGESVSQSAF